MIEVDNTNENHAEKVAQHYNALEQGSITARTQSRIFYMRNFNNWIKSQVIAQFIQQIKEKERRIEVLDLCAGKGGDMLKWREAGVHKVVFVDIADVSVEHCKTRYQEMINRRGQERFGGKAVFQAEFHVSDLTRDHLKHKYESLEQKFHLASCQFSFHYCFESLNQAENMIRNAAECLHVGGYLLLTIPNSNELVRRLRSAEGNEFGNQVYKVQFLEGCSKQYLPLFGAKYHFHLEGVVNCPEFLVHIPTLTELASRWGLNLIMQKSFAEYFTERVALADGRALLGRMQSLEPFPAANGVKMMAEPKVDQDMDDMISEQYNVAQKEILRLDESESNRKHTVGTLSQDKWDATSLYSVLVFRRDAAFSPSV